MEHLCKRPGTNKERNQTIRPTNENCTRKTKKMYQNAAVWLMLLHKNSSLYVLFSLCKKWQFVIKGQDNLNDNFVQQIYRIFSFLTSIFTTLYRYIFETLKKPLYFHKLL